MGVVLFSLALCGDAFCSSDSLTAAVTPGNTSDRPEHPEVFELIYHCFFSVLLVYYNSISFQVRIQKSRLSGDVCFFHCFFWLSSVDAE